MDTAPIIDFLQTASAPAVAEKLKEIPFTEENVRRVAQEYLNIRDDGVRRELVRFLFLQNRPRTERSSPEEWDKVVVQPVLDIWGSIPEELSVAIIRNIPDIRNPLFQSSYYKKEITRSPALQSAVLDRMEQDDGTGVVSFKGVLSVIEKFAERFGESLADENLIRLGLILSGLRREYKTSDSLFEQYIPDIMALRWDKLKEETKEWFLEFILGAEDASRNMVKFLAGKYSFGFQRIDDSTIRLLMDSIIERGEVELQSIRNILYAFNFPETRHHNRYFIEKLLEKSDSVTLNPASERDGYYGASITSLIPQEYQSPWIRMCASKGMCRSKGMYRWFTPRIRKDLLVAHRKLLLPPLEEILREVRGKKESAGDVPDETGTIADRTEDLQSIASTVNFMYLGEMNERELSPEETDLAFGSRAERIRFFLNNIGFFVNTIEKTEPLNVRNIVLNYNHGFDRLNEASVAGMDSIEWMDGTGAEELFLRIKDSLGDGNGSGVSLDEAKRFVCGCESLEDKISSIGQNTQKALSDLCLAVITLDAGRYGRFDGDIL